jgi:transcriptional regulator
MYIPKHFEVTDKEEIFAFIEGNAFGQLISNVQGRHFSTHLPFLVSKDKTRLFAHLAKSNPQITEIEGQEALITFEGPHDYISPSWYSEPSVPTWNYQTVHVYGKCEVFHDSNRLKEVVDSLANKYESGFEKPWQPEYKATMLGAIVGVEVLINEVQCKYKLSQNRPAKDQELVIQQLKAIGSKKLAVAMEQNKL